jgi:uncharacterized membrane protein YeiH
MADTRVIYYNGYEFQLNPNGEAHITWKSGASHTMNAETLWAGFKASTAFLTSAYRTEYASVEKAHRIYGSSGVDVLSRSTGGGLDAGAGSLVALVMGVITAAFGGILRDLLGQEPSIVMRKDVYVSASVAGAVVFLASQAASFITGQNLHINGGTTVH